MQIISVFVLGCVLFAGASAQCGINYPYIERPIVEEVPIVRTGGCAAAEVPLYPTVSSCGPSPTLEPIRALGPLVLPPTNGPIFVLPSRPPPPPTVISHKCSCTKTVVKPQLYQRVIQVQKNQRFLKKTYTPVVEKIAYCARPRC